MVGIYKITNKVTNQFYIGQSIDIQRRFIEHKTPKANGNNRLHQDMKKYGIKNFEFKIIELCELSELSERELYFIKKLNPYYNKIGKSLPEETKKKISDTLKKHWGTLSDEAKIKIIKNNLKGPPVGHAVSKETRKKISKRISEIQKQKVICLETGEIFLSVKDFEKSVGACTGTCAAYWKGKIKSVKGYHVEKCRD